MNEPAFPCAMPTGKTNEHVDIDAREIAYVPEFKHFAGLSMRDYFAGQVIAAVIYQGDSNKLGNAIKAYEIADAMMAVRKAKAKNG